MKHDTLRIGRILKPQGVHGQLKILPLTDDPERFSLLDEVLLENKEGMKAVKIRSAQKRMDAVYLDLEGVESREDAEKLRGIYLAVPRDKAIELPEDHEFICDLIGCEVFTGSGQKLGELKDVLQYGAADVYVIEGERNLMVPALKKLFTEVDVANKRMVLDEKVLEEVALWDED